MVAGEYTVLFVMEMPAGGFGGGGGMGGVLGYMIGHGQDSIPDACMEMNPPIGP